MKETNNSGCSGCLGFVIMVLIVAYIFNSCVSEDDNKNVKTINSYNVIINIDYEWVSLTSNNPMNIIVDDKEIKHHHKAGEENSYSIKPEEGTHEIYLKNDTIYETKKIEFEVDKDNTYFDFGAAVRLTFGVDFWQN